MNLLIVSPDPVFARMLELECTERGVPVLSAESLEAAAPLAPEAKLILLDAALLAGGLPAFLGEGDRIVVGYPEELAVLSLSDLSRIFTVTRPFLVEELMDSLFGKKELFTPEYRPRRKKAPADNVALDEKRRMVYYKGESAVLTPKEFALFALLYQNRGSVVSREAASSVFDDEAGRTNVVDVYVSYLRTKLDHRFHVRLIGTVRGRGYMIE